MDGAHTIGGQSAASSISFFFKSTFEGVIPESYSKNPDNVEGVGRHTVSDSSGSYTIRNVVKIRNSGTIQVINRISKRQRNKRP